MRTHPRLFPSTFLSLLALTFTAGCGSSATTSTATSPTSISRCSVSGNVSGQVPAQGGSGSLSVSAARECAWQASAEGQWLSIKAGAIGQGDGSVEFSAAANPDPVVRRGAIVLNEQKVEVMQAAGECTYSLSAASDSFAQSGGSGQFEVRASSTLCTWTAQSDASWVAIRSGASSKGTATVQFDVESMTGQSRAATITAAGLRFGISQQSSPCSFSVAPLAHNAAAAGGPLTVTVTTGPSCAWTASSAASWVSLASAASGTGNGTATFNIAASPAARAGSVVVAGQTVNINQGGAAPPPPPTCSFTLSPESATIPAAGGAGAVTVSTTAGCPWTAVSNAPWVSITGGASGNGSGQVSYQVGATTAARGGTLTIAGRTFTVNQGAGCTFSISPDLLTVDANGGNRSTAVAAPAGCAWTAASNASWIDVRSNGGSGSEQVQVTIAENKGQARSGNATIAGLILTVNQAAPVCSYKVSPLEIKLDEDGKFVKIKVETADSCSWTASSNVAWVRVFTGAGSGNDEIWIYVSDNEEGKERTGIVTVAGQAVTVIQKKK